MLVLASTSPYRRELLSRLQLEFEVVSPGIEESALPGEAPATTALRLAEAKARAATARYPRALIIGSDQVAELDGTRLEKPGAHDVAVRQLEELSGRVALFHTAVALLNANSGTLHTRVALSRVTFRQLSATQIEHYLRREQPYDCAGSAKSEGLGIALLRSIEGDDPTALIGLPLIALVDMLEQEGCPVV
jgi:septum formation protein